AQAAVAANAVGSTLPPPSHAAVPVLANIVLPDPTATGTGGGGRESSMPKQQGPTATPLSSTPSAARTTTSLDGKIVAGGVAAVASGTLMTTTTTPATTTDTDLSRGDRISIVVGDAARGTDKGTRPDGHNTATTTTAPSQAAEPRTGTSNKKERKRKLESS